MLARLFEHLEWADARVRDALGRMPQRTPEAERALTVFAHILGAEHVWLSRLEGRRAEHPVWPSLDFPSAVALAERNGRELKRYVTDAIRRDDLAREIEYTNSVGQTFRNRVDDILMQIATHGVYHRGQLALLARQGGGEPASTDYIAFVRGVPAARTTPPQPSR